MRALEQAGCGAAVRAVAVRMDRRVLHFGEDEHSTSLYSPGCWNFAVSRRDLNEVLLQSVLSRERVTAEFQAACKQIDLERKTVVMETPAGDVVQLGYDLLVGADGASSVVRDELEARGNLTVHRQVLPSAYKELTLNPASDAYPPSAIHIWPRNGFFLVGLPNLAGEFTGTLVMPAVGPGGFDELTESRVVREFVQRHFPGAVRRLERLDAEFGRNSVNRIATVAPFLGQGINAGFEDCFVLQQLLHQYGTHLAHVLPRYTEERKDNADAVAALSMQNYAELSAGVRQRTDVVSLVNFSGLAYKDVLGRLAAHS
jgi:kynurenine 3-monooxygenase